MFASLKSTGRVPIWGDSALEDHVRPALKRAGIKKHVSWHVFRHSFATLLKSNGEEIKTVQESLLHSTSAISLDVYTQAIPLALRHAQERITSAFNWEVGPTLPVPNLFPDLEVAAVSC